MYDNILMVTHSNIVSVFDYNARVCQTEPWRHLANRELSQREVLDKSYDMSLVQDPFKVCSLDIRMLKLREQVGYQAPRILVFYENNAIRMLHRDVSL